MPLKTGVAAAVLATLLGFGGCAVEPMKPTQNPSLYQRLGGSAAITAVVDETIVNIAADPRINQRFRNATGPSLKRNLVELLCARSGGPCSYAGSDMAAAHEGMNIRDDELDALVEDLARSLDRFKVARREKAELLAILAKMRNAIVGH